MPGDKKISELDPAASLTNAQLLAVAEGGANFRLSGADLVTTLQGDFDALGAAAAAQAAAEAASDPLGSAAAAGAVPTSRTLTAGSGLAGGGDLSADRTFDVNVDNSTLEINADTLRVKALGTWT